MIERARPKTASTHPNSAPQGVAESRLDPLTGNCTIFAPHRSQRPDDFADDKEQIKKRVECPFCPGNEQTTPPPVWIGRIAADDSSLDILNPSQADPSHADLLDDDWSVRVVPNKYPAVGSLDGSIDAHGALSPRRESTREMGLFQRGSLIGGHEVVIESRQHVQSLTQLDVSETLLVFKAFRDRLRHWREIPGISYISTFKNVGARAGASLRHTHSQLIATNQIPPSIRATIDRMVRHRATTGCCLQCDLIRAELKARQRIVWRDDSLVAYCPFASHLPMLVRITTVDHQACYEDLSEATIESVSRIVGRVVSWLEKLRPGTAYNFCLHTRPPGINDSDDAYHWSIEIFPRMTQVAGFEWSSHCMINPVLPEQAASKLRACALAEDPRVML